MKIFTVLDGAVSAGASVETRKVAGGTAEIDTISVGEEGRGSRLEYLVVDGSAVVGALGYGPRKVFAAEIGSTRAGATKLLKSDMMSDAEESECLVVFRTGIGFRGGNSHKGERHDAPCPNRSGDMGLTHACPACGELGPELPPGVYERTQPWTHSKAGVVRSYDPFPGTIIARGVVSQGAAGRMGSGEQLIAILREGDVVRVSRTGRLYGVEGTHYVRFDGRNLIAATWQDRMAADLF